MKTRRAKLARPDDFRLFVRPIPPMPILPTGAVGLCSLNGDVYELWYIADLPENATRAVIRGYRLVKEVEPDENGELPTYDLEINLGFCHCQGSLRWAHTGTVCKHRRGLMQFRDQGDLL